MASMSSAWPVGGGIPEWPDDMGRFRYGYRVWMSSDLCSLRADRQAERPKYRCDLVVFERGEAGSSDCGTGFLLHEDYPARESGITCWKMRVAWAGICDL